MEVPAREAIAASFGVAPAGEGLALFAEVLAELEEEPRERTAGADAQTGGDGRGPLAPVPAASEAAPPGRISNGRRYPHRVTLDYEALRRDAFDRRLSMAHLLRGLIQLHLSDPAIAERAEAAAACLAVADGVRPG